MLSDCGRLPVSWGDEARARDDDDDDDGDGDGDGDDVRAESVGASARRQWIVRLLFSGLKEDARNSVAIGLAIGRSKHALSMRHNAITLIMDYGL